MSSPEAELLIHDHAELGDLLAQLVAALKANDVARSHATLDLFWARLAMHIRAEHLHLFPAISQALKTSSVNKDAIDPVDPQRLIADLRDDHNFFMRELTDAIVILRRLLDKPKPDAAAELADVLKTIDSVRARLVKHNQIEEQGVYLWTSSLLTQADQAELVAKVHKELENMPPRFRGA